MPAVWEEIEFGGLFNSNAQSKTPRGRAYAATNVNTDRGIIQARDGYTLFGARSSAHASDVGWGFGYAKYSVNTVHRLAITGQPTGGYFTLTLNSQTTGRIVYNASADGVETGDGTGTNYYQTVKAALEALTTPVPGDIIVRYGPLAGVFTSYIDIEYVGQYEGTSVSVMTGDATNLTGGSSPAVSCSVLRIGGSNDQFIVALQKNGDATATLYSVDATTGTFTQVATGLHASDWFFQQYGDKVLCCNENDGIIPYTIGNSFSASSTRPVKPTSAPTLKLLYPVPSPGYNSFFTSASIAYSGWTGGDPTSAIATSGTSILFTTTAALTNADTTITITLNAAYDLSWRDIVRIGVQKETGDGVFTPQNCYFEVINNDATPVTLSPLGQVSYESIPDSVSGATDFQMVHGYADKDRTLRDNAIKVKLYLNIKSIGNAKTFRVTVSIGTNQLYYNIPPDVVTPDFLLYSGDTGFGNLEYAYTYGDASATESELSPSTAYQLSGSRVSQMIQVGNRMEVKIPCTTDTNATKIFVYRKSRIDGMWHRVHSRSWFYESANSTTPGATVTFEDSLTEAELAKTPAYGVTGQGLAGIQLGQGKVKPKCIGIWKQAIGVGAQRQIWLSGVGRPFTFAPSPDDENPLNVPDPDDEGRPVTEFVADNRAEEPLAIIGQDSCYIITDRSAYAKVGDSPAGSSVPRRLPGSRGTVGRRAASHLGGGVLIGAYDALRYYSVGRGFSGEDNGAMVEREETKDIRTSYGTFLGASGSAMVTFEDSGEIVAYNTTRYLALSKNGAWGYGTLADSTKAGFAISALGRFLMDTKGRILKVASAYTTDNGTAITWTYETGWYDGGRMQVKEIIIRASGTPTYNLTMDDGLNGSTATGATAITSGEVSINPQSVPGFRFKIAFAGGASDSIEQVLLRLERTPSGSNN